MPHKAGLVGRDGSVRACMMSRAFFDTNVLVYASDMDEPDKRDAARSLMRRHAKDHALCISTQVIQEFYVTVTRKLDVKPLKARDIVHSFRHFETVTVDADDINRAIDGNILWQVSFWDALIIVAAQKANCSVLYSEDLTDGQAFDSLKIENPFNTAS